MQKYVFININGSFGFKIDEIHEILETDVPISDEIYNRFFELQNQGKQFKVKNINGSTFEEIFEEIVPVIIEDGYVDPDKLAMAEAIADLYEMQIGGGV